MTIGRNSRMSSVRSSIRAPKFLDKASGFYGRLDEPETATEVEEVGINDCNREGGITSSPSITVVHSSDEKEEAEVSDFTEGLMEDDDESLLRRKPSRRSNRWRRSSRRKQKEGRAEEDVAREERPSLGTEGPADVPEDTGVKIQIEMEKLKRMEEENEKAGREKESVLVHFPAREDADDQVLIRDKKRGREDEEEEMRMTREQEDGMKMVKRKNYRKALDRALRRGWEAFIANLYSVTLVPVNSSPSLSSPLSKKKHQHNSVLAEFQ